MKHLADRARLAWRLRLRTRENTRLRTQRNTARTLLDGATALNTALRQENSALEDRIVQLNNEAIDGAVVVSGWLLDLEDAQAENQQLRAELAEARQIRVTGWRPAVIPRQASSSPTHIPLPLGLMPAQRSAA